MIALMGSAAALAMTGLPPAMHRGWGSPQIELRALEAPPPGDVLVADGRGVLVGPSAQDAVIVTWDRVKSVSGPRQSDAARFMALADRSWRARTRLERGDAIAAEPLFEEAFRETRDQLGPTGAVVAEGLLRCRLRRGAHVLAAEAWLALLEAAARDGTRALHPKWAEDAGLSPVVDPATGLVPAIPPIWCGPAGAHVMAGLPVFAQAALPPDGAPMEPAAALGVLYLEAARFEAGQPASVPDLNASDPGVALVRQIVAARIGDAAQRQSFRAALEARLPRQEPSPESPGSTLPAWMEAWCRVAVGRSLLREESPEQRRLGVIELLHVPARLSSAHPYLAGVALAEASVALADLGDAEGSAVLLDELRGLYPSHPVLEWDPIRSRPPRPPVGGRPVVGAGPGGPAGTSGATK